MINSTFISLLLLLLLYFFNTYPDIFKDEVFPSIFTKTQVPKCPIQTVFAR